jgi:hypothetical protein
VWSCGGDGCLVKWAVDASAKEVLVMGEVYALADLFRGPVTLLPSQLAATSLAVRPGYCTQVVLGLPCGTVAVFDSGGGSGSGSVAMVTDGAGGEMVKAVVGLNRSPHMFLAASSDCFLSLFDGVARRRVAWHQLPAPAVSIDISCDDSLVAVGHASGLVTTWSLAAIVPPPASAEALESYVVTITTAGVAPPTPSAPSAAAVPSSPSSATKASPSAAADASGGGGARHGLSMRLSGQV